MGNNNSTEIGNGNIQTQKVQDWDVIIDPNEETQQQLQQQSLNQKKYDYQTQSIPKKTDSSTSKNDKKSKSQSKQKLSQDSFASSKKSSHTKGGQLQNSQGKQINNEQLSWYANNSVIKSLNDQDDDNLDTLKIVKEVSQETVQKTLEKQRQQQQQLLQQEQNPFLMDNNSQNNSMQQMQQLSQLSYNSNNFNQNNSQLNYSNQFLQYSQNSLGNPYQFSQFQENPFLSGGAPLHNNSKTKNSLVNQSNMSLEFDFQNKDQGNNSNLQFSQGNKSNNVLDNTFLQLDKEGKVVGQVSYSPHKQSPRSSGISDRQSNNSLFGPNGVPNKLPAELLMSGGTNSGFGTQFKSPLGSNLAANIQELSHTLLNSQFQNSQFQNSQFQNSMNKDLMSLVNSGLTNNNNLTNITNNRQGQEIDLSQIQELHGQLQILKNTEHSQIKEEIGGESSSKSKFTLPSQMQQDLYLQNYLTENPSQNISQKSSQIKVANLNQLNSILKSDLKEASQLLTSGRLRSDRPISENFQQFIQRNSKDFRQTSMQFQTPSYNNTNTVLTTQNENQGIFEEPFRASGCSIIVDNRFSRNSVNNNNPCRSSRNTVLSNYNNISISSVGDMRTSDGFQQNFQPGAQYIKFSGCNCGKSKCIQMYCSCFSNNNYCDPQFCTCKDCKNFEGSKERDMEQKKKKQQDPELFTSKFQLIDKQKRKQNEQERKVIEQTSQNNKINYTVMTKDEYIKQFQKDAKTLSEEEQQKLEEQQILKNMMQQQQQKQQAQRQQAITLQDQIDKLQIQSEYSNTMEEMQSSVQVDESQSIVTNKNTISEQLSTIEENDKLSKIKQKIKKQKQTVYKNGCTCKKSGCRKKYCECFNHGLKCSYKCTCVNCKNKSQEEYEEDEDEIERKKEIQKQEQILADIEKRRKVEIEKRKQQAKQRIIGQNVGIL